MKKVLVTGSRGFVGATLLRQLSVHYDMYGLDTTGEGDLASRDAYCDITDYEQLRKVLGSSEFDAVLHCAALAHVDRKTPVLDISRVNVGGTENLVRHFCVSTRPPLFVFFSTVAVYGENDYSGEVTEDTPTRPGSAYALSKTLAERVVSSARLPWLIFRFAPIYGVGRMNDVMKRVSPLGGKTRFRIGNAQQRTSLCSIDTVTDVIMFALQNSSEVANQAFNVADIGQRYSQDYILDLVKASVGNGLEIYIPKCMLKGIAALAPRQLRPKAKVIYWKLAEDNLYSTEKIENHGFISRHELREVVRETTSSGSATGL